MILQRTQPKYTERIIQFGTGKFLRAFIGWQIDLLNEQTGLDAGIVAVKSTTSPAASLNNQDGLYTVISRGLDRTGQVVDSARLITSVNRQIDAPTQFRELLALAREPNIRYIFSNTTEAGIVYAPQDSFVDQPPASFPAKLTRLLYERYTYFGGDSQAGLVIIPCELIDDNGPRLKEIVRQYADQWQLSPAFVTWLDQANVFCSSLVDRIVTNLPETEQGNLGYHDAFATVGETFYLFVIEGPAWLADELHLNEVDLNLKIVADVKPYKIRKVGILNGAHTALVPVAYLSGLDTVREAVEHPQLGPFLRATLTEEIIPSLDQPAAELQDFAEATLQRFRNPFIQHQLLDISLNSMAKFRARLLPQLLTYRQQCGQLPPRLVFSLAALIRFYKGERNGQPIPLRDNADILSLYRRLWEACDGSAAGLATVVDGVLGYEANWQQDLRQVPGLAALTTDYLIAIEQEGIEAALRKIS